MDLEYLKTLEVYWQETDPDDDHAKTEHFDSITELIEDESLLEQLAESADYEELGDRIYDFINLQYKWKVGELLDLAIRDPKTNEELYYFES